ncbi:MAG: ribonuclease D [Deltaproteobacteria bacterium]|nr:ribonuclease D [Deltaproteobacteria bacterium]
MTEEVTRLITTTTELTELCRHIRDAGRVAVDTEFVWERTFYPELGIVQLAIDEERGWLLDIPALAGHLDELGAVLADPAVEKIIHDARQDLTILKKAAGGYPKNIFDTRLAAGFVGPSASLSLYDACRRFTGRTLDKGETRSNWLKRPLSPAQCRYALYDVFFLPEIRSRIMELARKLGRCEWIAEEMKIYDDPALYDEAPLGEVYGKVKGAARLQRQELAVLKELAAWRDREARRRNRPRRHIIPDDPLLNLAMSQPDSIEIIKKSCGLSPRAAQRYGAKLREIIRQGRRIPQNDYPPSLRKTHNRNLALRARRLLDFIQEFCSDKELDPALIANRQEIEKLLRAADPPACPIPLTRGWRLEFIGREILQRL